MALWRDRLAERQLLLIVDDAASSKQVRPLLPSTGGSLVLVTSRRHLSALEDATAVSLDTLPPDQAAALLVRLAGRAGVAAGRSGGGRDPRFVRVPAASDRDGGPSASSSSRLVGGRAGGRAGGCSGPARADGDGEPVGGRRVRPVLREPDRGPAAAVSAAGAPPRRRHRWLRRSCPGRHQP